MPDRAAIVFVGCRGYSDVGVGEGLKPSPHGERARFYTNDPNAFGPLGRRIGVAGVPDAGMEFVAIGLDVAC